MPHKITILNAVEAMVLPELAALIQPCLSFPSVFYKPGFKHRVRVESKKSSMRKIRGAYLFYAGLLDHVLQYCKASNIEVEVEDKSKESFTLFDPELPNITFRKDQLQLLNSWLDKPRGILMSPTGTGKTVLGAGCLSSFDYIKECVKVIWLCHTKDLMKQAYEDLYSYGFRSLGRVGNGFEELNYDITIATRQSFRKLADEYNEVYDVVVVDEVHHVSSLDGEYHYILSKLLAPFRLGLTASDIKAGEPWFAATGLIGPVVDSISIGEAIEMDLLAKPIMKMLKTSVDHALKGLKYADAYSQGIVHRLERNQLIATTALKHIKQGHTVLIMVTKLEHGDNIKACIELLGEECILIEGLTKSTSRDKVKDALNKKHIKCVVASVVWKEGINIPSLNCVINAAGGKDVLQSLGRGLRKTSEKDVLYYYDIFDPSNRYLIEHFGIRLCFYMDNGWL